MARLLSSNPGIHLCHTSQPPRPRIRQRRQVQRTQSPGHPSLWKLYLFRHRSSYSGPSLDGQPGAAASSPDSAAASAMNAMVDLLSSIPDASLDSISTRLGLLEQLSGLPATTSYNSSLSMNAGLLAAQSVPTCNSGSLPTTAGQLESPLLINLASLPAPPPLYPSQPRQPPPDQRRHRY